MGDPRYHAHCDFATSEVESSDDDEWCTTRAVKHRRVEWLQQNYDALADCYAQFRSVGQAHFGGAFYQLGTFSRFCDFVYINTILGAANSKVK